MCRILFRSGEGKLFSFQAYTSQIRTTHYVLHWIFQFIPPFPSKRISSCPWQVPRHNVRNVCRSKIVRKELTDVYRTEKHWYGFEGVISVRMVFVLIKVIIRELHFERHKRLGNRGGSPMNRCRDFINLVPEKPSANYYQVRVET